MKKIHIILFLCLFYSANAQWERVYTSQYNYIEDISFYDVENGAAIAVDGTAFISNNSGYSWTKQTNNYQYSIHNLLSIDKNNALLSGKDKDGNNCIFKTNDRYKTYSKVYTVNEIDNSAEVQRLRSFAGKYWALCSSGIVISTDNISTWENMDFGDCYFEELIAFDETEAYLCGSKGSEILILKTTDGGETWTETRAPSEVMINGFSFVDKLTGWAAGNNGKIYKTTDGGISWTSKVLMSKHFKAISFVNANEGWAVGTMGAIYSTIDGGENWSKQESGVNDDLHCITKIKYDEYSFYVLAGGGETSILYNEHTVLSEVKNEASDSNLITCIYNNEILTIQISGTVDLYFSLEIFDIDGCKIGQYELSNEQLNTREKNINIGHLSKGLYFCKFAGEKNQLVKPLLVL